MKLSEQLKAARQRQNADYFNGYVHGYCDNSECTGREIRVRIKTYCADDPVTLRCPLCGEKAIPNCNVANAVETLDEYTNRSGREARRSVNRQLYQKRTGDICVPASLALDDSLPE